MTTLGHRVLVAHGVMVQNHQVDALFNNAIEVYLYRMASLIAMIALMNSTHTISDKHLKILTALAHKPAGQRGGESAESHMPSDYYGYTNAAIWDGALDTNSQTVDFGHGIARPAIDMTGGARADTDPLLGQKLRENLTAQKIKMSPTVFKKLMPIVVQDVHLLIRKLGKSPVTPEKMASVLRGKRFTMFA